MSTIIDETASASKRKWSVGIVRSALEAAVGTSVALGAVFLVGASCDYAWRVVYRVPVEAPAPRIPRVVLVLPEGEGYQLEARSKAGQAGDWLLLEERAPSFNARERMGNFHELSIPATAEVVMVTVRPARASRVGDLDE